MTSIASNSLISISLREWIALRDEKKGERLTLESKQGRMIRKMADLQEHPSTKAAGLQEAEILALQLYTGII